MWCFNDNNKYFNININMLLISWAGHYFITCEEGVAILLGGQFQIRNHYLGGVILINVIKVVQSSNEHD